MLTVRTLQLGSCGAVSEQHDPRLREPIPGSVLTGSINGTGPRFEFTPSDAWTNRSGEPVTIREIVLLDAAGDPVYRASTGNGHFEEASVGPDESASISPVGVCVRSCGPHCDCPARAGGPPPCAGPCRYPLS